MSLAKKLQSIELVQQKLAIKKQLSIQKALTSNDPEDIIKANLVLKEISSKKESNPKSYFMDPQDFQGSLGFKDKNLSISYGMLKSMSKTPIINAIIRTRISQLASFAEPQKDEFSVGYKIRRKKVPGVKIDENSKADQKKIYELTKFVENCGDGDVWGSDDFDTFVRKFMRDSLTYDQGTMEVVRNKKGDITEFHSVDASTIRVADDYDNEKYNSQGIEPPKQVKGYYPTHVQIYNNNVQAEFYPWEMCFGIRNPSSNIYNYGYGISELEELVSIVTSLLWGEEYNRNFFKQGSAPKGILRVNGNFSDARLAEFRQQWNATIRGVQNSWKTPVLEADKVDWIDLQRNNRDMEFTNWIEFLIKISCAIFTIDPSEVNFPLQGGANDNPLFEGNNESRIKHSRDKGLYPLLKFLQARMNKFIISQKDPNFEFVFVGLDSMTPKEQAEYDEILLRTRKTTNELRKMRGDEDADVEGGDYVANPTLASFLQMEQSAQMMGGGEEGEEEGGEEGEEEEPEMSQEDQDLEASLDETSKALTGENPFVKSLNNYLTTLNND